MYSIPVTHGSAELGPSQVEAAPAAVAPVATRAPEAHPRTIAGDSRSRCHGPAQRVCRRLAIPNLLRAAPVVISMTHSPFLTPPSIMTVQKVGPSTREASCQNYENPRVQVLMTSPRTSVAAVTSSACSSTQSAAYGAKDCLQGRFGRELPLVGWRLHEAEAREARDTVELLATSEQGCVQGRWYGTDVSDGHHLQAESPVDGDKRGGCT